MANPFVHCELATTDVGKAKGFYGKLFDWKFDDMTDQRERRQVAGRKCKGKRGLRE